MKILTVLPAILFSSTLAAQDSDTLTTLKLDEVVVTGQFEAQSLSKSVYKVRVIGPEQIKSRNATNIQGVLNTELGIRFSNDPLLGTDISLMGMSGQNVKILLDGVPLFDRNAERESLNQIDINTIERIEIVEGPMSVTYGTDALAGVINIITRKTSATEHTLSISARVLEESAGTEYDPFSNQGLHNEAVNVNWRGSVWNASGGVSRNNFGGWQGGNDDRAMQWLPKDQWLGNGSVGLKNEKLDVWYRLNYLNEVITNLGNPSLSTNIAVDKKFITNRFTHQVQGDYAITNAWRVTGMASYQDYSRKTQTTTYNATTGEHNLSPEPGSQDEAIFSSATLRATSINKVSTRLSVQSGIDININEGTGDRIEGHQSIHDYAVFASAEWSPGSWISLRPGLRFIYNSAYDAPPAVPSLNAKVTLSEKWDARFAYGYGFRAPALRELYFSFFDANHSIQGNPDLKAEYSNSFSVSVSNRSCVGMSETRINTSFNLFYNEFENRIALSSLPNDDGIFTYENIDWYKTTGGTATTTWYAGGLTTSVGCSYIGEFNEFSEDDATLPAFTWTPEVNVNLSYTFEKLGAGVNLFYKFSGQRNAYRTVPVENETEVQLTSTNSFHWADISLSKKIIKTLEMTCGVKNLFNVTNVQRTATAGGVHNTDSGSVQTGYGRSYFIGLAYQWNK